MARIATLIPVLLGLALFALGVKAQLLRLALFLHQGLGFTDPYCTTGYCDYSMFWLAGIFAHHGQGALLYDHTRYAALASHILPYQSGWWPFVYPPTILLPAALIASLPLAAGYYALSALTLAASALLLRRANIPRWCILAGLISPAAMWNLYLGQFGLLCGALLAYGLATMHARPLRAGAALSLLAIKPQYALLVPVAVLARRNWRTLIAGALGLLFLLALSCIFGGTATWAAYLGPGRAAMRTLLNQPFAPGYQAMGSSVFWMLRSLHASLPLAYAGQGAVSLTCALATWRLWRNNSENRLPVTVFLSLLASPYGFTDDLAIYSVLLPTLARRNTPWRNAALAWLYVAPAFIPKFVTAFGFLPTPLLLLAALCLAQQKQRLFTKKISQRA
ncbi:MAG: glycosyltransferase family 87 protein [Acidocella sp.]|nr:glycosyltransferase family 87 protein [Acidocella sp.]